MTIVVRNTNTVLVLEPWQTSIVLAELANLRVRPYQLGTPFTLDGTLIIEVSGPPRVDYLMLGRTMILETASNRVWPFYVGMLITEWFDRAHPYSGVGRAFAPATP